jgi:sugar lactone lactonase YvrE
VLERIELDRACFACMLGGEDRTTLFLLVTAFQGLDRLDELLRSRTGKLLTAPAPAPRRRLALAEPSGSPLTPK